MEWFRHYHGLCTDPKLHKISRAAKVSRGIAIAAWCAILEHASQASDRGDLSGFEVADLAFLIDQKPSVAQRVFEAIWASDLIAENRVAAWSKRQKESDDGKKRVQRHRARKVKALETNETDGSGNVTCRSRTEQNRTDKKKEAQTAPGNGHDQGPQTDMRRVAYDVGKKLLGQRAGSLITKGISTHSVEVVIGALEAVRREDPLEPIPFFQKCLQRQSSRTRPDAFSL